MCVCKVPAEQGTMASRIILPGIPGDLVLVCCFSVSSPQVLSGSVLVLSARRRMKR